MLTGLKAALIIAIALILGAAVLWAVAIAAIEIGDLIHRMASRAKGNQE